MLSNSIEKLQKNTRVEKFTIERKIARTSPKKQYGLIVTPNTQKLLVTGANDGSDFADTKVHICMYDSALHSRCKMGPV